LAYHYASMVLGAPFPAGEPLIATEVSSARDYAMHVLKGRFPAGEAVIAQNPFFYKMYQSFLVHGDKIFANR
jgi:hypothetical protein